MSGAGRGLSVFLVAGEESGDQLGADLMRALKMAQPDVAFAGVGGLRMAGEGLKTLFPIHDIAILGLSGVVTGLPRIVDRLRRTAAEAIAERPDVMVIIDSPDFTHRVARRVRRRAPEIPILDYVSPSVWAWRSGRARAMRAYVDRVMAILPFEPEVHRKLGGPPCDYVGHPLIEKLGVLRPGEGERRPLQEAERARLLVLPGSRRSEISRLMPVFGETIARVSVAHGPLDLTLPAVPHLAREIREAVASWPVKPQVVEGEAEKFAAFRRSHAALAASGTVTVELALSGVPMVVAYRLDPLIRRLKFLGSVPSIVLSNLILGENVIPEFVDEDATAENLATALLPLLKNGPERSRQTGAFERLDQIMRLEGGAMPSARAAEIVLDAARGRNATISGAW